jgi:hypothetical protein
VDWRSEIFFECGCEAVQTGAFLTIED